MSAMLEITTTESKVVIDARAAILSGSHPRHEIFALIEQASKDAQFEIHVPRRPVPLIKGLEQRGYDVKVMEIDNAHFQLDVRNLDQSA